jgi:pimeloyl-ACP methyl ester carboxylesterase
MGEYLDIAGHETWVVDQGSGPETVLLLHGGLSNSDDLLGSIGAPLTERYRVVAFDRDGHGRTKDTSGAAFHYEDMATETVHVLESVVRGPAHLVGWSDGGIIALLVAIRRPDLVAKIVTIGANYHHDGIVMTPLDPDGPEAAMLASSYAQRSPDGAEHFPEVLRKTLTMFDTEPELTVADLAQIAVPALVISGDDEVVRLAHTLSLYEALPNGQLAVVPGASHVLPIEKPEETAHLVLDFLAETGPPATLMPVRRRSHSV